MKMAKGGSTNLLTCSPSQDTGLVQVCALSKTLQALCHSHNSWGGGDGGLSNNKVFPFEHSLPPLPCLVLSHFNSSFRIVELLLSRGWVSLPDMRQPR